MSFGGAVSAMITSLKNNKRERKSAFDKLKNVGEYSAELHFEKEASKKQLEEIRTKLQKENREALIKKVLFFVVVLSILIYFFAFHKY